MTTLTTNGLVPDATFPTALYEAVHSKVVGKWSSHSLYDHYAGSWNALAYRFQGAAESGVEFSQSIALHGATPSPQERY